MSITWSKYTENVGYLHKNYNADIKKNIKFAANWMDLESVILTDLTKN